MRISNVPLFIATTNIHTLMSTKFKIKNIKDTRTHLMDI